MMLSAVLCRLLLWLNLLILNMDTKYKLFCSILQSDGAEYRDVKYFDSLIDLVNFLTTFRHLLQPTWLIVQMKQGLTVREKVSQLAPSYHKIDSYEQDLPF